MTVQGTILRTFAWLLITAHVWTGAAMAGELSLDGVHLGMTPAAVHAAGGTVDKRTLQMEPLPGPDGGIQGYAATTKRGFPGGGFFHVAFRAGTKPPRVHTVTLNHRTKLDKELDHAARERLLETEMMRLVSTHGPYDKLCVHRRDQGLEYRLWWNAGPEECSLSGSAVPAPYLHAVLTAGSWLEVFITLRGPL